MLGILDILFLILVRRHSCTRCGKSFWAPPVYNGAAASIGRESYICECGNRYETGRREWIHLTQEEKRKYLWSGLVVLPLLTAAMGALGGFLLRWQEPPQWFMPLFIGFLGLLSGLICCAVLIFLRGLPVMTSKWRTRHGEPSLSGTTTSEI